MFAVGGSRPGRSFMAQFTSGCVLYGLRDMTTWHLPDGSNNTERALEDRDIYSSSDSSSYMLLFSYN